jgi:hypothetical protein
MESPQCPAIEYSRRTTQVMRRTEHMAEQGNLDCIGAAMRNAP